MKKYATKLTITNTVNENKSITWFFCDDIDDRTKWISDKNKEADTFNFSEGSNAYRYYSFDEYQTEDMINLHVNEFENMSIRDFIEIIKQWL